MRLAVEILDSIFSFLVSDRETLFACFKDPVLSPVVERHFFRHLTVRIAHNDEKPGSDYAFEPNYVSKLVSENPLILIYVRILEIQAEFGYFATSGQDPAGIMGGMSDDFAKTLLMFPSLDCIVLTPQHNCCVWHGHWSDEFRAALKDRLNLPTVRELHVGGDFPLSLLDHGKNIEEIYFSGPGSFRSEGQISDSALPQLKSLSFNCSVASPSLLTWLKLHVNELQSLKCGSSFRDVLTELLGVCSETLNKLEVDLRYSPCKVQLSSDRDITKLAKWLDCGLYKHGEISTEFSSLETSPVPLKLQQLTIRTEISLHGPISSPGWTNYWGCSWLPATAEIINLFISAPRHLILDINISSSLPAANIDLTLMDLSPLEVLGAASVSIPRIDIYVHTGVLDSAVTQGQLLTSLDRYEDVKRSITDGVLVIHPEKRAPDT